MRALVLGGASWNTMVYLDALPKGVPQTIHHARSHETVGSTGAGKSFALAALGIDTTLHAALGEDQEADRIRKECERRNIRLIEEVDTYGTPRHFNLMDKRGGRLSIFINAGGHEFSVDKGAVRSEIAQADVIFLNIVPSSVPVLELLEEATQPIWVDLHDWDGKDPWHWPFIRHANVVQISTDILGDRAENLVADLQTGKTEQVILTKGAKGATIYNGRKGITHITAQTVKKPVDVNGAGDTFMVGYWHGLAKGLSTEQAGKYAARLAAQTISQPELAPDTFN